MKNSDNNIFRCKMTNYISPDIVEIVIDNEISLVLNSFIGDPDEPGFFSEADKMNKSWNV